MVESVAKERTNYLLVWLENTELLDQDWIPSKNFFDTLSTKEQVMVSDIRGSLLKVMNQYLVARREALVAIRLDRLFIIQFLLSFINYLL
jgi:hypothetical protein